MKINGEYIIRNIVGEKVVVPIGDTIKDVPLLIVLNETGEFVWKLLTEGHTKQEIINIICKEYEVNKQDAETDFDKFISYLKIKGINIEHEDG